MLSIYYVHTTFIDFDLANILIICILPVRIKK